MNSLNLDRFDAQKFNFLLPQSNIIPNTNQISTTGNETLPLPKKFEILYSQTKALIVTLKNCLIRRQTSNFTKVKDAIERQTKHSFTQLTLCKCVRILPEGAILLEWHQDKRRNLPHQLAIIFVSGEPLNDLYNYARNYLIDLVKGEHIKFLKERKIRIPSVVTIWHHNFDLELVPDVVPVDLKPPEIQKQSNIFESLRPIIKKKEKQISEIPSNEPEIHVPKSCQKLSSYMDIVKKVQEKVSLQQTLSSIRQNKEKEELLKIADLVNLSFTSHKKRSLPLSEVTSIIRKNKSFDSAEPSKIDQLIDELIIKSDNYFSKLNLSGNTFLKIDDKRLYQTVRAPIYKAVMEIEA